MHEFDIEHGQLILAVCNCTFKRNDFFFQSLTSASCHSALRACPELQNPLSQKAKENLLPGEKVPFRADEGCTESALPRPSPTVCDGPHAPEGKGYCQE